AAGRQPGSRRVITRSHPPGRLTGPLLNSFALDLCYCLSVLVIEIEPEGARMERGQYGTYGVFGILGAAGIPAPHRTRSHCKAIFDQRVLRVEQVRDESLYIKLTELHAHARVADPGGT